MVARWEPDARGRMVEAALDLFTERGFEGTTAGDIAQRAGVTERTFYRHFADKREVLFDGTGPMTDAITGAIAAAPVDAAPLRAALAGVGAAGRLLEERGSHAVRRARVVEATPALRERELLKMDALARAAADALRERGTVDLAADLAGRIAVDAFEVAFERWVVTGEGSFARRLSAVVRALPSVNA